MRDLRQALRGTASADAVVSGEFRKHLTMKNSAAIPVPATYDPTEAEIQHQAYLLWLEGGCRTGGELDDWLAARERLRHRVVAHKPRQARLATKATAAA